MSTANKLTYLNNTKQLLKQKINNLGGSIDEQTTFREYTDELQDVYDNLPKATGEGTEVSLNTIKGRMLINEKGNTIQDTTEGYNLLPSINTTRTINGITFTHNENGTITANGTATANALYPINVDGTSSLRTVSLNAGTYVLVDSIGDYTNYFTQSSDGTNFLNTGNNGTGKSNTLTITETKEFNAHIFIRSGVTVNNILFKPMIVKSTDVSKPYEQYTNGASPNPSYEQPIKVVTGENTVIVGGKNLINLSNSENGGIDANGNLVENEQNWRGTEFIPVKPNTQYTLSTTGYNEIVYVLRLYEFDENKNFIYPRSQGNNSSTLTITTSANTKYLKWTVFLANTTITTEIANSMNLMLTKGTDTTYEPYISPISKQLDLGNIELCKIGTVEDYIWKDNNTDKWYKHNNIFHETFNGTENITYQNRVDDIVGVRLPTSYFVKTNTDVIANYYRNVDFGGGYFLHRSYGVITSHNEQTLSTLYISAPDSNHNTDTLIKSWLGTHNLETYYVLNEAIDTEITNTTLINQLNAIDNLMSNNGTTIISTAAENGNANLILSVSALKGA